MIPAAFDYVRAASLDEALAALAEHGEEAKLLAGGHSLIPLMRLRLATPAVLVDIGPISELSYIRDEEDHLAVGALTRHCDIERSALVREQLPVLAHVAGQVGDPQVRHRGTLGGTLAHGDPASDLPAVALATNATIVVRGTSGERTVPAAEFFTGFLETVLGPDEIVTEIRFPKMPTAGWSFQKFTRRAQDWAIVGVVALSSGNGANGVALVNVAPTPVRSAAAEAALSSGSSPADAADAAAAAIDPHGDLNATPDFRRHLCRVLVRRALEEAGSPRAAETGEAGQRA